MKELNRRALIAAGLITLGAMQPLTLAAQRQQVPNADTPRLLVNTFHAADGQAKLGVDAADEVRNHVQDEYNIKDLWVIPRDQINKFLTQSGYPEDSALSVMDLKELARQMRADEMLDATVTKTANGVHIEPTLVLSRDVALAQPLPAVDARNAGDAASTIEKELTDARKQLADNQKCENALREQKPADAVKYANAAIQKYPNAVLGRLCLMTAYNSLKQPPDSILRVTGEVLKIDPKNRLALLNAVDAYKAKNDTTNVISSSLALAKADPTNTTIIPSVLNMLAQMGRPEIAVPIIDTLLKDDPTNTQYLEQKWKLLLAAHQWKDALAAGDAYVAVDTAAANVDYFTRSVAAAASDSEAQLASQIAAKGVAKFPNDAGLHMLYAQTLRKAGQLQQAASEAEKAVGIDPKTENGFLTVIVSFAEMNQPDSAIAWGKKALASGADKDQMGAALASTISPLVKKAQDSKTRADWQAALTLAQAVDSIAPTSASKFFVGVSSFSVGLDALQNLNTTKKCSEAQLADDMWTITQVAMPAGAETDKNTAGTILSTVQQYSPYITQAKAALCKKK